MTKDYAAIRAERLGRISEQHRAMLSGWPRLDEIGVAGVRGLIADGAGSRASHPGVGVEDVAVTGPEGMIPVRIYRPLHQEAASGIILHVHSGGFVGGGGLATFDGDNSAMAAGTGCVVVAPDFRLPPEHKFPAGLDDCWAVLKWVEANAAELGADGGRIAVGGGCTGGNFAAVLALMARDAGSPKISLQFLEGWVADARGDTASQTEFAEGYGLRSSDNQWVVGQYLPDLEMKWDWRVSPILVSSVRDVAPARITVGEWDILRDEDIQYADRLRDAGVPVEVIVSTNQGHLGDPATSQERRDALHAALRHALEG